MTVLDWIIVVVVFVTTFGLAARFARRASKGVDQFFAGGRSMPWWLAGTSMVATTFAADTPLLITEVVADTGISGNWIWWNGALGGMLTVFFFAKLWRRSGVLTDVEFVELRYQGAPARWLRGIKAVYFGLFMNCIVIGWVALAMETVLAVLFPGMALFGQTSFSLLGAEVSAPMMAVGLLMLVIGAYSLVSGLWGIVVTDAFQFLLAMTGSISLAWFALDLPEVGGLSGLLEKVPAETVRLLPAVGGGADEAALLTISTLAFFAYFGVQWWSSWYPGAEPGGGGYIAQRMLSARSERDSVLSALWFNVAHYCVRPWPWIIVALVALVLYPDLENAREGYVLVMRETLPPGLLGLLFAAFLAAFMSTISTQLNWGTSYLVNDLYARFIAPEADARRLVAVSRGLTFGLAILGFLVASQLDTITEAWGLVLSASAGLGLVLILRWYWWRVNAWSELTATVVPLVLVGLQLAGVDVPFLTAAFPVNLYGIVVITTVAWLTATFVMGPTEAGTLDTFYRRVRPGGAWGPVAARHPDVHTDDGLGALALRWILGVAAVYASLFGLGGLILGTPLRGLAMLTFGAIAIALLVRSLRDPDPASVEVARGEA